MNTPYHLIKCNIAFFSATKTLHHREAVTCCDLGVERDGGGVLCSRTNAQLQRDIVHLSQISGLCDFLSILSPSSLGKNTLSCVCEIKGICVALHQWAHWRIKSIFSVWSCEEAHEQRVRRGEPWWRSGQHARQINCIYMAAWDTHRWSLLEITQKPENTRINTLWLQNKGKWKRPTLLTALIFSLSCLKFEELIIANKNSTSCKLQIQTGLCNRSFVPFLLDPKYIFNGIIISLGGLSCMLRYTWKTVRSLHMISITCITLSCACASTVSYTTKTGPITLELSDWSAAENNTMLSP